MTLVTLCHVTDAATMRKISFWRYLAVNRKTLFAALTCALLVFSMLGCGTSNKLQSIQLSISNTEPGTGVGTYVNLYGADQPGQFFAWGNYSNGTQKLLAGDGVHYQISITPGSLTLDNSSGTYVPLTSDPNANPPQTVELSPDGVITAVAPFECTWENFAVPPATAPSFAYVGSYTVTATYGSFTSPPAYIPIASDVVGVESVTNPNGLCTNPPTS
jgi:hypothetical protein